MRFADRDDEAVRHVPTSHQLQAQAARSAYLLTAIENAVTNLASNTSIIQTLANEMKAFIQRFAGYEGHELLDPEGRACDLLEKAAAGALRLYEDALRRRESARDDPRLVDDDGVVDSFTGYISALADYHNALENLHDTIATLDSLQSPVVGRFEDVDHLLSALHH